MVKNVFNKTLLYRPVALAILGWLAFGLGQVVDSIGLKLLLLSAARVLPDTLCLSNSWSVNQPFSVADY